MVSNLQALSEQTKELSVLYVEDEASVREQTRFVLEILFSRIDTASDGAEGWEKFQNFPYDILITDISMPKMDGLELSRRVKEKKPSQKVLIISAHNTTHHLLEAIDIGVDGFLLKPLELNKMITTLGNIAEVIRAKKWMEHHQQELEKEVEKQTKIIKKQLITDKLTGLKNRYALLKSLEEFNAPASLILMNIDNFNSINVVYGYEAGDKVLTAFANMLKEKSAGRAEPFYLGNDEFAILCKTRCDDIPVYVKKIQEEILESTIRLGDQEIKISITIGIALKDKDPLKHAYIALKEAQNSAKSSIKVYSEDLPSERLHRKIQEFSPIIRQAIEEDRIVPFFQGIRDNETGTIQKYESLVRIVDKEKIYSPFLFLEVAEKIGELPHITKIMIDKCFAKFQNNDFMLSINISESDLIATNLPDYFAKKVQEYGIDPSRVILEVLEGISTTAAKESLEQLMALKKMGFRIAIDDFGAQNSNFERVHAMQVDFIKIDGSFIKNIDTDPKSYAIAKTITDFANSIGAESVAEFVHSENIQKIVEELGIQYSQGFYFAEPNPELEA